MRKLCPESHRCHVWTGTQVLGFWVSCLPPRSVQWSGVGVGQNRGTESKWSKGQSQPLDLPLSWKAKVGQAYLAPGLLRRCCLIRLITAPHPPPQLGVPAGNYRQPGSPYSLPPTNAWLIPTPDTFSFVFSASPQFGHWGLQNEACKYQAMCKRNPLKCGEKTLGFLGLQTMGKTIISSHITKGWVLAAHWSVRPSEVTCQGHIPNSLATLAWDRAGPLNWEGLAPTPLLSV